VDELYVIARRVLLDALEALADHRNALILVGAQAIYLRTGEADLAVSPYTTDADLGIDPSVLSETPPLERALMQANFAPPAGGRVGIWSTARTLADGTEANVQVDLLVPRSLSPGTGRRAAKLKGHHELAARMVVGLEGVVVDFDVLSVGALAPNDGRRFETRVAGPAGLLVAKLHKIAERTGSPRQKDKDALDVLRLLRLDTSELNDRLGKLLADERSRIATHGALQSLAALFGRRTSEGSQMAARAVAGLADAAEIALSCEVLANDLLELIRESP
jgi:hypothetical protein